ncbi:MAG: hypothetical protein NUV64_02665 [Parcubacteria group bacterium]|nr:hypothetical protein [Parcubacteria group bacterium]MCR4342918.1 hypothetical protein [Patescibacteria group bacterium]
MNFESQYSTAQSPKEGVAKNELISSTANLIIHLIQDQTSEIYQENMNAKEKSDKLEEAIINIIKKEISDTKWYPDRVKELMKELLSTDFYDVYKMGTKEKLEKATKLIGDEYEEYSKQIDG